MRWLTVILISLLAFVSEIAGHAADAHDEGKVDVAEIIFGHIGDSYGWHITEWNGRHVVIPLLCTMHGMACVHVLEDRAWT